MSKRFLLASAGVLTLINLGSGVLGFWVFKLSGVGNQIGVQLPVTMLVGVGLVVSWFLRRSERHGFPTGRQSFMLCLLAMLFMTVLFVPLHFVLTGYLTSLNNLLASWLMQVAQIVSGLIIAAARLRDREWEQENDRRVAGRV